LISIEVQQDQGIASFAANVAFMTAARVPGDVEASASEQCAG
jgi:hypothetical protein